ncbi:unnamed protein product [Blepharisma stoltei]|uniref:DM10 domain-containing protein n=1 Tax=Blepharisma stoltei TaxID=1481888 RepID=A0AAU9J2S2_9CILI|nr:unnamed protein product [Blepharisma stoltei]
MDSSKLPKLPGFSFNDPTKTNFHKHQMFAVRDGHMTESTKFHQENASPQLIDELRNSMTQLAYNTSSGKPKTPDNVAIPRNPPAWIKYDRQVLRFNAYFQEPVHESSTENFRVRKCVIMFHLDDETTYVTEPRVENSGIPQGVFIKKHRIPKGDGTYFTWRDFALKTNVNMYGRVFRIVDCDEFTRNFYEEQGIDLGSGEGFPDDRFDMTRLMVNFKQPPEDAMDVKEYNEVKLGGGHPNRNLRSFVENDRKVLSFDVMWNDTSYDGGIKFYKMNYYLFDQTMEIKELRQVNTGNETFPMMLRRMKVPKAPILTPCPALALRNEEYYIPNDLVLGNTIQVYGKDLLVCDCDEYTKRWYREELGIEVKPVHIPRSKNIMPPNPIPPHNGYGTEEDSIGNVLRLQPNAPKPDMYKMFDNDQHILRFEAKLVSSNPEDELGKFILSFYPGDDTIKVYQVVDKNSGVVGGKFLERRKFKNPYSNQYYQQKDCVIGNTLILQGYRFLLVHCDEYTFTFMEERPSEYPQASIPMILRKIMGFSRKYGSPQEFLVLVLRNIDPSLGKNVQYKVFLEALEKLGIKLTLQEEASLIRKWNKGSQGQYIINLEEAYNALINA